MYGYCVGNGNAWSVAWLRNIVTCVKIDEPYFATSHTFSDDSTVDEMRVIANKRWLLTIDSAIFLKLYEPTSPPIPPRRHRRLVAVPAGGENRWPLCTKHVITRHVHTHTHPSIFFYFSLDTHGPSARLHVSARSRIEDTTSQRLAFGWCSARECDTSSLETPFSSNQDVIFVKYPHMRRSLSETSIAVLFRLERLQVSLSHHFLDSMLKSPGPTSRHFFLLTSPIVPRSRSIR